MVVLEPLHLKIEVTVSGPCDVIRVCLPLHENRALINSNWSLAM